MPARFASNLSIALLGGVLVSCALVFAPAVVQWLALGVGGAAAVITLAAFATRGRGPAQRLLDAMIAPLAGWTIIAATTYTGATQRWMSFSAGAALCALAVSGLIAHEVAIERDLRGAREALAAREVRGATELRQPVPARPDVAA
jgi:hypothetical protein